MILFHGSNVEVKRPRILTANRALDFGVGFYTTSDFNQAQRWAMLRAKRRQTGHPIVVAYETDDERYPSLNILKFDEADAK